MTETIIEKFSLKKFIGEDKPLKSHGIVPGESDFFGIESQSITDYRLIVPYRSIDLEFLSMKHNKQCILLDALEYVRPSETDRRKFLESCFHISPEWGYAMELNLNCFVEHRIRKSVEKHYSLPQFAVFSLDNPESTMDLNVRDSYISVNDTERLRVFSQLSKSVEELRGSKDMKRLYLGPGSYQLELKTHFNGIFPEKTRNLIKDSFKWFNKKELYIVSEVVEWNVESVRRVDPLVIGIKKDNAFLIDVFDPTTFEDYVSREFIK